MTLLLLVLACLIGLCNSLSTPTSTATLIGRASRHLFHPAFPLKLLETLSEEEEEQLAQRRQVVRGPQSLELFFSNSGLPWAVLPQLGINEDQKIWNKGEIEDAYEKNKHAGHVVWAQKATKPERGCILLNHWKQSAVYVTDYDVAKGAKGYEIRAGSGPCDFIFWPPLALEMELYEKKWQCVDVSPNLQTGEVFQLLPESMKKAPWELIFLLLLEPAKSTKDAKAVEALFDTGMSPKQGLIAYMRLLASLVERAELFDEVPAYAKIFEVDIGTP